MKPQFKPEEIYLDLSKLSEEQQRKVISLLPEPEARNQYEINKPHFILCLDEYDMWWVFGNRVSDKTELTYSQFLDMVGESEEVLQVENDGWIKIESEKDLPKKGTDCHVFFKTGVQTIFNNIDDLEILTLLNRCSYYMPIIKPLPPKF